MAPRSPRRLAVTLACAALAAVFVLGFAPASALAQGDPYEGEDPSAAPPPPAKSGKASIAVLDFNYQQVLRNKKVRIVRGPHSTELTAEESEKILQGETNLLTDKFITTLVKSNKFKVVEREALQKVMDEQMLSDSGAVDPSRYIELGKLIGADYLLMGSISLHDLNEGFRQIPGTNHYTRILKAQMICDIKIVNSTTGRIVAAENARAVKELKQRVKANSQTLDIPAELTDDVHRQLITALVQKVLDTIYPAKVMAFTGGVLTFNRGEGTGVGVGQRVAVYMQGEEMIDPDTGEVLGSEEIKLCEATIIQVLPKFSKAKVSGAVADVPNGSIVRTIAHAAPDTGRRGGSRGGGLPGDD